MSYRKCRLLPTAELNALAAQARTDKDAAQRLVDAVWPLLRWWAGKLTLSGRDASDAEQEAVLGVYQAIKTYDPSKSAFTTYLGRAVWTKIRQQQRSMDWQMRVPHMLGTKNMAAAFAFMNNAIYTSHDRLPASRHPAYQQQLPYSETDRGRLLAYAEGCGPVDAVILFGMLDGHSYKDLGVVLGLTRERARQLAVRAIRRAKKSLVDNE